ncbi:MAG: thiamine phosphate synthase [Clostridia bacterium]
MLNLSNYKYILYLVTDKRLDDTTLVQKVKRAIQGGVNVVQLRDKNISSKSMLLRAKKLKEITKEYNVPLIINDRLDIALAVNADGLHVGQDDLPIDICKKYFKGIIGVSASNMKQAIKAYESGADYIGYGAIFPTGSKSDYDLIIDDISEVKKNINVPLIGIGGIKNHHIKKLAEQGLDGVAVISAILGKEDPEKAAKEFVDEFKDYLN